MSNFGWRRDFRVGVDSIDNEHMELISIINDMHGAINDGVAKDEMGNMLDRLLKYADKHFTAEEKLMKKYNYPAYEEHAGKHTSMKAKVKSLIFEHRGGRESMTYTVLDFLQGWLAKHIMETDRKLGAFLVSKGKS